MRLKDIAKGDTLRVAINTGNRALVQVVNGGLQGVSPALATRLASEIGLPMEHIVYDGAGKVFNVAHLDKWDVAFLAIDEKRAEQIAFTRPYITIEATYAVRAGSEFETVEDVDQAGVTVLTSIGSAYDMHLTKNLKHASLEKFGTPPESFKAFRGGRCDAVAGVRQSLEGLFADDPNFRILPGVLTSVKQAMVLPYNDNPLISALDDFVARAMEENFIAQHQG